MSKYVKFETSDIHRLANSRPSQSPTQSNDLDATHSPFKPKNIELRQNKNTSASKYVGNGANSTSSLRGTGINRLSTPLEPVHSDQTTMHRSASDYCATKNGNTENNSLIVSG